MLSNLHLGPINKMQATFWHEICTCSDVLPCCLQAQPPVRLVVNVAAPSRHDFDTQPLCEVVVRLTLCNCLQSFASFVVEIGGQHGPQHQQSGKASSACVTT